MFFPTNLGLKPAVEECAERRDSHLKDQPKCCQLWAYCRCVNSLCSGKVNAECKGELTITCGKQLVKKCEDYDEESKYGKKCSGLSWNVLLDKNWVVPTNPSWDDTSSDEGGGGDGTGRAVEAGKLSFVIIGGAFAFILILFLLCMVFYCWSVGSKKKKTSQQRSTGQNQHKVKTKAAKKKIGRKGASGACAAAGGAETSADLADAKSRSKVRHSSTPRTAAAARPGGGGSDTEKNLKDTKLQGRSKGPSKAAQGMSSFNSRQVNTVDLKTTGANARVAIRYTKFRKALA